MDSSKVQVVACIVVILLPLLPLLPVPAAEARAANKVNCKANIADLISCMPCIRNTKPDPKPTQDCCKALEKADLPCLCSTYKNSPDLSNYVNPKLAMALPAKCKLTVPKQCH